MKKLLLTLTLCSCIIGSTVGIALAHDKGADKTVQYSNQVWNETFNSGDSDALATLYADNASLSPGNGHKQIAELFKSYIDNGVNNHSIETIETYRDDNQIVQLGRWQADGVNDKQEIISFGGILMTVLEKNAAGEWKTRSHIWNMTN